MNHTPNKTDILSSLFKDAILQVMSRQVEAIPLNRLFSILKVEESIGRMFLPLIKREVQDFLLQEGFVFRSMGRGYGYIRLH